ncbi:MAG: hypothetical protein QOG15_2518 [Solirubrobacteraceae bacterium]|jgi:hypothetical protein|nr:hypothetical protein [Solirubrobacteraceae bacterium]
MATVDADQLAEPEPAAVEPGPGERPARVRSQTLVTAVALSTAAGVIHGVAMVDHFSHWWAYGVFFLVITYAQVLWAIWIYRHPDDRRVLVAGAVGNLLIVGVWIVSRSVGVPIGPDAWNPERIGAMDIMASIDQVILALAVVRLVAPAGRLGSRLSLLGGTQALRLGIMLCSASVFAILLGSHHHH